MRAPADRRRGRALALAAVGALSLSALRRRPPATPARRRPRRCRRAARRSTLDPADFTVDITNRYWPMEVGRPLGLRGDRREGRRRAGRGDRARRDVHRRRRHRGPRRARPRHPRTARSSRTPSTGTRRTPTATSGTSASRPRSTRTARSRRPRARGRPASTAPSRGSPSRPIPRPGMTLPPGVPGRRGGGRGRRALDRRAGAGARPASTPGALLTRDTTAAGARPGRAEVLRAGDRPGPDAADLRRSRAARSWSRRPAPAEPLSAARRRRCRAPAGRRAAASGPGGRRRAARPRCRCATSPAGVSSWCQLPVAGSANSRLAVLPPAARELAGSAARR